MRTKGAAFFQPRSANRFLSGVLCLSLLAGSAACSKRPGPVPVSLPTTTSSTGETEPRSGPIDPSAPVPTLEAYFEPQAVTQGESSLLVWEARHATRVVISQGVGPVVPEGQIKIYPDQTMTYRIRAEGPGGSTEEVVTIEVRATAVATAPPDTVPLDEQFSALVKPVFFDFDSSELSQEARLTLDGNIRWLMQGEHLTLRFVVQGHCDERGTEEYNLALGDKRARVVRDYMVRAGINSRRIVTVSQGEERPFATGDDQEEIHALNRRAHFVLIPDSKPARSP